MLSFIGTYWLGLIVMACSERFQRLGDLACGTIVVVESRETQHGVIKLTEPAVLEFAERLPADLVVGRSLARTLAIYVGRRRLFTPARRIDIARHVAQPLIRRYNLPLETNYDTLSVRGLPAHIRRGSAPSSERGRRRCPGKMNWCFRLEMFSTVVGLADSTHPTNTSDPDPRP